MADIFVSYARADYARVAPLVAALEAQGWSVWWDTDMAPGQAFDDRIAEEIEKSRAVVVVWTPASVASRWVRGEAREGADRGILVPVRFEAARLPIDARAVHTTEFDNWNGDAQGPEFKALVQALAGLLATPTIAAAPASGGEAHLSIAVLPFANLSSDPEQDYFSDGLTEELINLLAQMGELRVAGRTSSFAFKGKTEDLRGIGQKLGVSHVLEGSVRRAGQRLRITAQLISCTDGFHLWSNRFDRELTDVFAIQDEIAAAVADALRVTLRLGETVRASAGANNVEAFDLMLRARVHIRKGGEAEVRRGLRLLEQALELDASFALGWCVLANAVTRALMWRPADEQDLRIKLDHALERAVTIAPGLWMAHEAQTSRHELNADWAEAEKENARSLALAPRSERAPWVSRGHLLAAVGRVEEAIPFFREAVRVEPFTPHGSLPLVLDLVGRHDEAEAEMARNEGLVADDVSRAWFALMRTCASKDRATVKQALARFAAEFPDPEGLHLAILERFDAPDRALSLLRSLSAEQGRVLANLHLSAYWGAYFGDAALALEVFAGLPASLFAFQITHIWHPLFARMRQLPGFKAMVRKLGIERYWRVTGQWGDFARPLGEDDFEIIR